MGDDIRPPVLWRRPNAKTYQYNQEFGGSYYQPMIQYIETKNRQGVFFERPSEKIHLPDSAETYMTRGEPRLIETEGWNTKIKIEFCYRPEVVSGVGNVDDFLVKSRSERMKEVNGASGK